MAETISSNRRKRPVKLGGRHVAYTTHESRSSKQCRVRVGPGGVEVIVPAGESVQLGRVGAHSLGTLFLDGAYLVSGELLMAIEEIARPYKGFYFGRFDVKAANEKALQKGENLKVIEINGVTSEATHIYDPGNSLLYGWKTLMQQWDIAFQIASRNAQNGHQPMPVRAFVTHWMRGGRQ